MAKMWNVEMVDCARTFEWNARHAVSVRIAEVYAHAPALADQHDSHGMHDLRISVKRLRYSLEFFAPCYPPRAISPILDALSDLQDYLGELHDADVFIPEFQRALTVMSSSANRLIARRTARPRSTRRPMTFERFRSELTKGSAMSDRAGVLGAINRMRRQRHENYLSALSMWLRLEADGFREKLEFLTEEASIAIPQVPTEKPLTEEAAPVELQVPEPEA